MSVTGAATPVAPATLTDVDVRIDSGSWTAASGTTSWTCDWDSTSVSEGAHTIYVRALMDTFPYDMGEAGDDPVGQYGAGPDPVVIDNANKHKSGIDFTVPTP